MALLASKQAGLLPSKQSGLIPSKQVQAAQTLWTPLNIPNLAFWFDDSDGSAASMTLGGSGGTTCLKQFTRNNSSLTAQWDSATKSAILTQNVFGSKPGLLFNTADTAPERLPSVPLDVANCSVFAAILTNASKPGGFVVSNDGGGARIDLYMNGTQLGIDCTGSDHAVGSAPSAGSVQWGFSSKGGTATPYVNGAAGSTFATGTGTNTKLCSGTYAGGGGSPFYGYRGGLVGVAGSMSASDVAKLAGFWGNLLGAPMPSGSPYASRPPYVSDP